MLRTLLAKLKKKLREFCTRYADLPAPIQITTVPPNALGHIVSQVDKKFGSAWDKTPMPGEDISTIMFRAGAKSYREQLFKEIHATSPQGISLPDHPRT